MGDPASTLRLRIHLQPRAARTRIVGRHGDAIKVQVHAPPVEGAANAALVDLLAQTLGISRRNIRIVHGTASRDKIVEINSTDPADSQQRLEAALARTAQPR